MSYSVKMTVNGKEVTGEVEGRTLLVQFLREHLGLTGTHVGCDTSQCGACTIHMNGRAVKSCALLATHCDGQDILTIEGLADLDAYHPLQKNFEDLGSLQCGFCGPGMILTAKQLLDDNPNPSKEEIQDALAGNLCRCTGYTKIVEAVADAAAEMRGDKQAA